MGNPGLIGYVAQLQEGPTVRQSAIRYGTCCAPSRPCFEATLTTNHRRALTQRLEDPREVLKSWIRQREQDASSS